MAKMGRPSKYSQELADLICAKIIEGDSLRTICKADNMPSVVTILTWLREKPDFLSQYELAKHEQAEMLAEELLDIADNGENDWMYRNGKDGTPGWVANGEHIQRSRLRVDTRKWVASKLKPKKYGDFVRQEHTGANGDAIKVERIERVIIDNPKN